jgi:hypothetical protein
VVEVDDHASPAAWDRTDTESSGPAADPRAGEGVQVTVSDGGGGHAGGWHGGGQRRVNGVDERRRPRRLLAVGLSGGLGGVAITCTVTARDLADARGGSRGRRGRTVWSALSNSFNIFAVLQGRHAGSTHPMRESSLSYWSTIACALRSQCMSLSVVDGGRWGTE